MLNPLNFISKFIKSGNKKELDRISKIVDRVNFLEKNPDIILASWCGKPVDIDSIKEREGWDQISAIKNNRIHEIDSSIILQPGPASLTDGLSILEGLIRGQ